MAMLPISAVLVILLIAFVVAEGRDPASNTKAKKVKCQDKKFYKCYHKDLYCPAACLRTCVVDCKKCKPVCKAPPPPPPPPPPRRRWQRSPPPPPPKSHHRSPPPPPKGYHHSTPPPPKSYHHSPPPPPKSYHHSPPPPPKSYHHSPPPPPTSYYHSPPPPPKTYPSPPAAPSVVPTPSPPPTRSPPPPSPPMSTPSLPPLPTSTPSPPLSPMSTPPPPPTSTSSPPPPLQTPTSPPPLPPTSTPPSSYPPLPPSSGGKKVRCKNKKYPHCYGLGLTCPSGCPDQCEVDCVTCSPVCNCNKPGAVCQDPRFIGGDGLTFYFHGKRDQDFCLVSDSNLHINGHFIGKRNETMGRDFTWVQSLGILFDNRRLLIVAKPTSTWDDAVDRLALAIDDEAISLPDYEGAYWESQGVTITRSKNTNAVEIESEGNFKIKAVVVPITEKESVIHRYGITEEDCFAHLDLSFKFYGLSDQVNGVLGQTYGEKYVSRVKMGVAMPVLGGDREFASSGIFSSDCAVARFNGGFSDHQGKQGNSKYGNTTMNCASGMDGRGVVCKR